MKMKETLQLGKTAFPMRGTCQTVKQNGKRLGKKAYMNNVKIKRRKTNLCFT